jgi:hypothetical protein
MVSKAVNVSEVANNERQVDTNIYASLPCFFICSGNKYVLSSLCSF